MKRADAVERAELFEAQALALLKYARLGNAGAIAEAANYITCAKFLRERVG